MILTKTGKFVRRHFIHLQHKLLITIACTMQFSAQILVGGASPLNKSDLSTLSQISTATDKVTPK